MNGTDVLNGIAAAVIAAVFVAAANMPEKYGIPAICAWLVAVAICIYKWLSI